MKYRPMRQKRYNLLVKSGFCKFEAQTLSKMPAKIPYMRQGITKRVKMLKELTEAGKTRVQFEKHIRQIYKDSGWTSLTKSGIEQLSPWAMLRDAESRYKDIHKEYVSPWLAKVKKYKNFQGKYKSGEEKYPKGKAYQTKRDEIRTDAGF